MSEVSQNDIYYLVFADDLVLLSGNLTGLEEILNQLTETLAPLGMAINAGKTKWLAFLPDRVPRGLSIQNPFSLTLGGFYLENVKQFVYLGFTMTLDLSKKEHMLRREKLLALSSRCLGILLKNLQVTNYRSLRSYYMALVRSQLYAVALASQWGALSLLLTIDWVQVAA
jgi:hypothetical protein